MERRPLIRPLSRVGTGLPAHVSIDEQVFRFIGNAGEESKPLPRIDCVILDVNEKKSRIYYGSDYKKGNPTRPLCFSDNGIAPSDRCDEPQAISCQPDPEGKTGCRWAVWGSDTSKLTGKGIPACREYAKIAIMAVVERDKKWVPAFSDNPGLVFFFAVPPASHRALSDYAKKCYGNVMGPIPWTGEEIDPDMCMGYIVTRITFAGTGKVGFEKVGFITEEIDDVIKSIDDYVIDSIIGKDDVPIKALPAPADELEWVQPGVAVQKPALPEPKAYDDRPRPDAEARLSSQTKPPVAATPRPRGRPRKNGNAPVTTPARIVTVEEVRNHAAQQKQEAKEAQEENPAFGIIEDEPEPSADVLDQFMNLDLK